MSETTATFTRTGTLPAVDGSPRDALLALSLVPGLGPVRSRRCIETLGSARAVLDASARALASIEGIGSARASLIRRGIDDLGDGQVLAREKDLIHEHGVELLAVEDPGYPKLLRLIPDPPLLLYVRGTIREDDALAVAIVGARRCSAYGRDQADRFGSLSAQAGLCVVSGGAYGIDAAAHRAALRVRGRTIAVLGSGLACPYPEKNIDLFEQIVNDNCGAVVSELPMAAPPRGENFPRRNRIISGLALGVLVVEAAGRSGALITARLAVEEHGREVMAVPGRADSPMSRGCHRIVREGWATLVTNVAEVLESLGEAGEILKAGLTVDENHGSDREPRSLRARNLTESQRQIVHALGEPRSLDQLVEATSLGVAQIQGDLTVLEIRGLLQKSNGVYSLRGQGAP